jgi:hypothetical protein
MFVTPTQVLRAVGLWPVSSQQVARRNALVASTALAERRRELIEVEEFLRARAARSATTAVLEVQVGAERSKGA